MAGGGGCRPGKVIIWPLLPARVVAGGAIRDDDARAQGAIIVEVLDPIGTNEQGYWVMGKYVGASDQHMRWWMTEGDGHRLVAKCAYHFGEGATIDCPATKRGASIHIENFRIFRVLTERT